MGYVRSYGEGNNHIYEVCGCALVIGSGMMDRK